VRLACIDAPEMGQAPYGEQAAASAEPVEDRQQGETSFLRPWIAMVPHRGRSESGEVNLNLAMWKDGMAFAVSEVPGHCATRGLISMAEFRANRRRYGVGSAWGIYRPWDFEAVRRSSDLLLIPDPVPGGRRYRCSEMAPYGPGPRNCCARVQAISMATAMGSLRKSAPLR